MRGHASWLDPVYSGKEVSPFRDGGAKAAAFADAPRRKINGPTQGWWALGQAGRCETLDKRTPPSPLEAGRWALRESANRSISVPLLCFVSREGTVRQEATE